MAPTERPIDAVKGTDSNMSDAKAKLKRRRVRREGPPQLQFVVATDLAQFRDESSKRSVRSQAMIHWRHEENKKKRRDSSNDGLALASTAEDGAQDDSAKSGLISTVPIHVHPVRTTQSTSATTREGHRKHENELWQINSASLASGSDSSFLFAPASSRWQLTATETTGSFPNYGNDRSAIENQAVTEYEESERHEKRQILALAVGIATVHGDVHDPFKVMPQFQDGKLDSMYLSRNCMRAFASDSTLKKWLPLMLSHPHIILSSTVLASTWLDMHNNVSGDSTMTARVKTETIGMINERLVNPATQLDDKTLIVILHLFAGEMWICNEMALRAHENGVATFVTRRGGLSTFVQNRAVGEVAIACCYHCDIICGAEMLPALRVGLPPEPIAKRKAPLPESPLYCPGLTFLTITDDQHCSPSTLRLLDDMRDLTNLFMANKDKLDAVRATDAVDTANLSASDEKYEAETHAIQRRLAAMPSAHLPGMSVTGDWVYESCRIAAMIYLTAIVINVPFPVAADPNWVDLFADSSSSASFAGNEQLVKPHLTEALYETLQRADTSNVWKNMSGVLYWVSAVGAAAARIPTALDMSQRERFMGEAYSVWIRRWLIMTSTRTMIVLVFEHPTAIIAAQRKLLEVQELIASLAAQRLRT